MFHQIFEFQDLLTIGVLIVMEGVLSIDNALVLGLLAKRVRPELQSKVLTYGLIGAFVIRLLAIGMAQYLMGWKIVKLLGGGYLIYIAFHYFYKKSQDTTEEEFALTQDGEPTLVDINTNKEITGIRLEEEIESRTIIPPPELEEVEPKAKSSTTLPQTITHGQKIAQKYASFWKTIVVVELTDLAFAIDSILAGIALVGPAPIGHLGLHPKLWVVVLGGMLGVMLMRVAAMVFIKVLAKFPRFELAAYLLVILIGSKLCLEWYFNTPGHEHTLDFHSPSSPAFIVFWLLMLSAFMVGFIRPKPHLKES